MKRSNLGRFGILVSGCLALGLLTVCLALVGPAPALHAESGAADVQGLIARSQTDAGGVLPSTSQRDDDDDSGSGGGGDDDGGSGGGGDDDGGSGGGDDGDELEGFLLARPDSGIGDWTVECEPLITCTVVVSDVAVIEGGIVPAVGVWIEADGVPQAPRVLLATLVRAEDYASREVIVRLAPGVDPVAFAIDNDLTHTAELLAWANIHLFTSIDDEEDVLEEILDEDGVVWAELNYINSIPESDGYKSWRWGGADEAGYVDQAAFDHVYVDEAHGVAEGDGVTIALLDTGIQITHPVFSGVVLTTGVDVVDDDTTPGDDGPGFGWGHGTHVAGILVRMAPKATIMPVRVLDQNGRGTIFALARAIQWAVDRGADIINLSLGVDAGSLLLQDTIAYAVDQGVVLVAAAGNENSSVPHFPGGFPGVIAVGAVDGALQKAAFSNYGDWVDIAAPGTGITSSVPFSSGAGYASWTGTSMSAPFVSGAAALLLSSGVAGADVEMTLETSATALEGSQPVGGLLDAASALGVLPNADVQVFLPAASRATLP